MKKGRPKISEPRTFGYRLRMNKEEMNQLNFLANELGKNKSEIIRDLIRKEAHLMYYGHIDIFKS